MKKYPKIGIRPTIDGRQGGVRESLEEKTMNLAKAVAELISTNLKNGDGSPVECVIADGTIGRVAESAACAEKFEREGVGSTITVTSCWCYGAETMDMSTFMVRPMTRSCRCATGMLGDSGNRNCSRARNIPRAIWRTPMHR